MKLELFNDVFIIKSRLFFRYFLEMQIEIARFAVSSANG